MSLNRRFLRGHLNRWASTDPAWRLFSLILCLVALAATDLQAQAKAAKLQQLSVYVAKDYLGLRSADDKGFNPRPVPVKEGETKIIDFSVPPGSTVYSYSPMGYVIAGLEGWGHAMMPKYGKLKLLPEDDSQASLEVESQAFFNIAPAANLTQSGQVLIIRVASLLVGTNGARFHIHKVATFDGVKSGPRCTIAVLSGEVKIYDTETTKLVVLSANQAVVHRDEMKEVRPLTRNEARYDISCKLAALGKPIPEELPEQIRPKPQAMPGSLTNSLGMTLVPVPGTKVLMCIHETRYRDFKAFLADNAQAKLEYIVDGHWGWQDYPVRDIDWLEAKAFCKWLSEKEGRTYRLPTDQEWSAAVGIGHLEKRTPGTTPASLSAAAATKEFPWGKDWPPPVTAGNLTDRSYFRWHKPSHPYSGTRYEDKDPDRLQIAATFDDGFGDTAPVMSFQPNRLGLYDLAGNVSELCEDWLDNTQSGHVVRGGNCGQDSQNIRNFYLSTNREKDGSKYDGFRIVLEQ